MDKPICRWFRNNGTAVKKRNKRNNWITLVRQLWLTVIVCEKDFEKGTKREG